ncbi:precorrin-4 C(11)-methyltransferase [Zhaonella formicivorans]|uniref:precorrin-4 C(11)-methyltransferase n=1 Tax=Zhaonella formicivorans TaxID=2528593 RepID=UPI0010DA8756|nr:precorrin-4 C(11)-methyltransferase [Zhaonella formicivorans]
MQVYFIGAGPGDPELITVKGQKLIAAADVIIYAGSLVNPELFSQVRPGVEIYNSATMNLEEVMDVMLSSVRQGKVVARVHTGDPSIYGAIREQMDILEKHGVPYEVVPGVSSFLAAAASLKKEYTLPGVSQTVILTRVEGRTPVPEKERLISLAEHQATLCIFLSVHSLKEIVEDLKTAYPEDTPVAVVYKASWPEEKIIQGTLSTIAKQVEEEGISKTALVLVGRFLGDEYDLSKLYDANFSHGYRSAEK